MVNYLNDTPDAVAEMLFRLGAIKVNLSQYHKLASGDYSPLYFDAKVLLSDVDARSMVSGRIVFWVHSQFEQVDAVVGVADGAVVKQKAAAGLSAHALFDSSRNPVGFVAHMQQQLAVHIHRLLLGNGRREAGSLLPEVGI